MKKLFALLLVGAMSISLLAGCGNSGNGAAEGEKAPQETGEDAGGAASSDDAEAPAKDDAEAPEDTASSDSPLIGISVPKAVTGWTAAVSYYAEKYCEDNNLNYKLVQAESTNDQANQVDDLIGMKPAAIVLLPINDELATAAQTILDAGIPLINFDRTLGGVTPDYYLAGDNPGCGKNGADWMVEQLGEDFTVVVCSVTSWGAIAEERKEGFETRLAEIAPNAKVLNEYASESASQEDGLKLMADVLQSNPEVDAVFCVDDEQGVGILQAINEAQRTDIKAVYAAGGGATNYLNKIEEGSGDMAIATVSYYPSMIADSIKLAVDVLAGEGSYEAKTIEEAVVIDKTNLEEWKSSIGYDPNSPY
ncbi:MAG: substrate-binding domain-containing protein [Eubacterium sp.]|nr:substrate-binding domain-containing protein [Eubacterium sp.]